MRFKIAALALFGAATMAHAQNTAEEESGGGSETAGLPGQDEEALAGFEEAR